MRSNVIEFIKEADFAYLDAIAEEFNKIEAKGGPLKSLEAYYNLYKTLIELKD